MQLDIAFSPTSDRRGSGDIDSVDDDTIFEYFQAAALRLEDGGRADIAGLPTSGGRPESALPPPPDSLLCMFLLLCMSARTPSCPPRVVVVRRLGRMCSLHMKSQ